MRAVVHDRYGPPEVLRVDDVERPVPKDDEVLVRVHASTVTRDGLRLAQRRAVLRARLHRPPPPEADDPRHGARRRRRGGRRGRDGVRGRRRGLRRQGRGANAEYVCVRESGALAHKPAGADLRGGGGGPRRRAARADLPAEGAIRCEGSASLVYGAAGSIGTAAVQLAEALRGRRDGGLRHEERRARALARRRRGRRLRRRRTSRRTARRTT